MDITRFPEVERRVNGSWERAPGESARGLSSMPMSMPLIGSRTRGFWWLDHPLPSGEYRVVQEVYPSGDVPEGDDGTKVVTFEIDWVPQRVFSLDRDCRSGDVRRSRARQRVIRGRLASP